jgi:hypothetical protein
VTGVIHLTDPPPPSPTSAAAAQAALTAAYLDLAGRTAPAPATVAGDLGGLTLAPGLYKSTSTLGITNTLTLDGGGNANAVWIFQIASSLTTAGSSSIVLAGGAQSHHIFWQVGSSATLGTNSTFNGSILALTDITLKTGATLNGRALARNGAVALDTNTVTVPSCPIKYSIGARLQAGPLPFWLESTIHVLERSEEDSYVPSIKELFRTGRRAVGTLLLAAFWANPLKWS